MTYANSQHKSFFKVKTIYGMIFSKHTNAKCHEVTLMIKLLAISVTWHRPHNKVNDIIKHVTKNTINDIH